MKEYVFSTALHSEVTSLWVDVHYVRLLQGRQECLFIQTALYLNFVFRRLEEAVLLA